MKTSIVVMVVGAGLLTGPAWASVDLNSATANQMQKELGLSRGDAMKVIEHRERQPFQSTDELSQIDGIDSQKAEQLKGKLSVQAPKAAGTGKATKAKKPKAPRKSKARKPKKAKTPKTPKAPKAPKTPATSTRPGSSVAPLAARGKAGHVRALGTRPVAHGARSALPPRATL